MESVLSLNEVFSVLKKRPEASNKGDFGKLLCVCGSKYYRGAAYLCSVSALRSGTGIVCLASTEKVISSVAASLHECTYLPLDENENGSVSANNSREVIKKASQSTAALLGCGMTNCEDTRMLTASVIESADVPLILDADALNSISSFPEILGYAKHIPIITPHIGEMARLCSKDKTYVKNNAMLVAKEFAAEHNCVVVLKDNITAIASPDGQIFVNTTGNAGLAKGGSGDVLSGIIAAFVAQGIPALDAARCGVFLHGLSADRCAIRLSQYGMLPSDILTDLCDIFRECDR